MLPRFRVRSLWGLLAIAAAVGMVDCKDSETPVHVYDCATEARTGFFEQRIEPLFSGDQPSSCNQCHLSGIDLEMFMKDTACQTMACMDEKGLVDLDAPQNSLVLSWISRADPSSPLITEQVIAEERQGILEWIEMTAQCGHCVDYEGDPCGEQAASDQCDLSYDPEGPPPSASDPGDCDDLTIERLFYDTFYRHRFRCYPCHFQDFDDVEEAPKWLAVGGCELGSLETLRNIEASGYINVDDPWESPIWLKPLAEEDGGVEHGGGPKIQAEGDFWYAQLPYWLERYAECQ